jgi:hypothetical protein
LKCSAHRYRYDNSISLKYFNLFAMASPRCLFCNCLSHVSSRCNSNMNGRRQILDDMEICMLLPECPDFNSFSINELRYIASKYALYERAAWQHDRMGNRYNREYLRRPIPLTLSKNRTVQALVDRWAGFAPIRELMCTPPEDKDCPICYENMLIHHWSRRISSWIADCVYTYDAKYTSPVLLNNCKHMFCGKCWEGHTDQNKKYNVHHNRHYVNCPMCRAVVYCKA